MRTIPIILNIQTIKSDDEIQLEASGICIYYNKKYYIISVHQGLPIKSIIINNKTHTDYIICAWCDLLIINIDEITNKDFYDKIDITFDLSRNTYDLSKNPTKYFIVNSIVNRLAEQAFIKDIVNSRLYNSIFSNLNKTL